MKPHGALNKDELLALVKPGMHLYKVFGDRDMHTEICTGKIEGDVIITEDPHGVCHISNWFTDQPSGVYKYLFDNYFHALAYSLKLKAEHGQKAKSEERTGMAGAP